MQLDPSDRKIIALLEEHGRRPFADIGREIGLSTAAVTRRVARLEDLGVIRGYTALVDREAIEGGVEAFVEVFCTDRTAPADVRGVVEGHPDVAAAFTLTGEADALLRLRVLDIKHLERAVERLRRHPNVARTKTLIVLSRLDDRRV